MSKSTIDPTDAARAFASLGGKSGKGKSKKRGSKAYYAELGKKGGHKKSENAKKAQV